jgi:5-methylcytosine-specific restriction endonuclease McrA
VDWSEIRLLALERDGYVCQDCKLYLPSGNGLVVHHIIPWRLRPLNELRWLVTLCGPDHMRRPEYWWASIPEDVQALLGVAS